MLNFIIRFRGLYLEVCTTNNAAYTVVYKTEKINFTKPPKNVKN